MHFAMIACIFGHGKLVVLCYFEASCIFVNAKIITDNLRYIHKRIVQLVSAVDLTLALQGFFVHISHEVVDSFIVVNEEKILKLSMLVDWNNDLFFDNHFSEPS